MKKLLSAILISAMCLSLLAGCSTPSDVKDTQNESTISDSSTVDTEKETYKIGINSYAENFESSQVYIESFKAAAEAAGNVELVFADCNADPQKLAANYDALILQGVDAIVDASWFAEVGTVAIEKVKQAGIPLITCDSAFDEEYSYLIGTDNYTAGVIAGTYLADMINEQWDGELEYLVLEYFQNGGQVVKDRMQGCLDGLLDAGIEIPDENVFWFDNESQTQKTNQITLDFLTAHPDATKVIIGTNNDPCAIGVTSAVEAANRAEDVISYSYGGENSALDLLEKDGNCFTGTVSFSQSTYGDFAIPAAISLIDGATDVLKVQGPTPFMIDRVNLEENR